MANYEEYVGNFYAREGHIFPLFYCVAKAVYSLATIRFDNCLSRFRANVNLVRHLVLTHTEVHSCPPVYGLHVSSSFIPCPNFYACPLQYFFWGGGTDNGILYLVVNNVAAQLVICCWSCIMLLGGKLVHLQYRLMSTASASHFGQQMFWLFIISSTDSGYDFQYLETILVPVPLSA